MPRSYEHDTCTRCGRYRPVAYRSPISWAPGVTCDLCDKEDREKERAGRPRPWEPDTWTVTMDGARARAEEAAQYDRPSRRTARRQPAAVPSDSDLPF